MPQLRSKCKTERAFMLLDKHMEAAHKYLESSINLNTKRALKRFVDVMEFTDEYVAMQKAGQ